jgi:hypothetical protein
MVEEALVPGHAARRIALRRVGEEAQGRRHSRRRRLPGHEPALDADRISGEREADRGHAREGGPRPAVAGEAVFGIRRLPEEAEGAPLEIVEKGIARRRWPYPRPPERRRGHASGEAERAQLDEVTTGRHRLHSSPAPIGIQGPEPQRVGSGGTGLEAERGAELEAARRPDDRIGPAEIGIAAAAGEAVRAAVIGMVGDVERFGGED